MCDVQVSGGVAAQQLSFSSYPGELFSDDDLYITSSKMVVLETTNHIYNFTILEVSCLCFASKPQAAELVQLVGLGACSSICLECCGVLKCDCAQKWWAGQSPFTLAHTELTGHHLDTHWCCDLHFDWLLQGLSPKTVPSWQRVRAANLLAADGRSWVETFKRHNSGTYNNQYMVVDLKRFEPRRQLQPGLLWVVEQLPGMVEAADMTNTLSRGYCECWPSFARGCFF